MRTTTCLLMLTTLLAGCARPVTAPDAGTRRTATPAAETVATNPFASLIPAQAQAPRPTARQVLEASRQVLKGWQAYKGTVKGYVRWGDRAIGLTLEVVGRSDGQLRATVLDTNLEGGQGLKLEYAGGDSVRVKPKDSYFWKTVSLGGDWSRWEPILRLASWPAFLDRYGQEATAYRVVGLRTVGAASADCLERTVGAEVELVGFAPDRHTPRVAQLSDARGVVHQLVFDGYASTSW